MLSICEKFNEIHLSDSDEVLLSFPVPPKGTYNPINGHRKNLHYFEIDDHFIHIHFNDNNLKMTTIKDYRLDGLQLSYDTKTKEGLVEVYQAGELRCDEKIDGYRNKFMLNICFNKTMSFESWFRPTCHTDPLQKDGLQVKHNLDKGRMCVHLKEMGNRTYVNNIFPNKFVEFEIINTDALKTQILNTTHKDGTEEKITLNFLPTGQFLMGDKKIYKDKQLISSGELNQDEQYNGPLYMYDKKGQKTEYEYYYGRRIANWTRRKKIAKWIGGLAVIGTLLYYGATNKDTPEKIGTQTPTQKQMQKSSHTIGE